MSWWWLLFAPLLVSVLVSLAREYYSYLRCSKYQTQGFVQRFSFLFGTAEMFVQDESSKTDPMSRLKKIIENVGSAPGLVANHNSKALVILKDLSLIREFYLKERDVCRRHDFRQERSYLQEYFPFRIDQEAEEQRASFRRFFQRDKLDALMPALAKEVGRHIERVESAAKSRNEWTDGTFVVSDWKQQNWELLYRSSSAVIFGESDEPVRVASEGNEIFGRVLKSYLDGPYVQTLNSSLNKFFCGIPKKLKVLGSAKKADQMRRSLVAVVEDQLKARAADPAYKPRYCMLDVRTASLSSESPAAFSTDALFREVAMYIISGFNATRRCMNGMLHNLAKHPHIAHKLYCELQSHGLVSGPLSSVTVDKLDSLQYMEAFMKESLRTTNVFPFSFTRVLLQDFSLGKYKFYRGDLLQVPYIAGFCREEYFPDAARFDPDRFASGLDKSVPPMAFTPFGTGSRVCSGRAFGEAIIKLLLVELVRRFEVGFPPGWPDEDWIRQNGRNAYKMVCRPRSGFRIF